MNWDTFVKHLQTAGYQGEPTLDCVKTYLEDQNMDTEAIEVKGVECNLEEMWTGRTKAKMDFTAAQVADELEQLKTENETMKNEMELLGKTDTGENPTKGVDIKVGKDQLSLDPKGGYKHAGMFYADLVKASEKGASLPTTLSNWSKALSTYSNETVGADGGFAVPTEFREAITSNVTGEDTVLGRTDNTPVSGNGMSFPADDTTPWQTSGGILCNWEGEADTLAQSKIALKRRELRLRKCTALIPVTEELLADSTAMETYITRKAGEKMSFKVDEAIFRGTGVGQPLGFLNGGSSVSVAKESGQSADTIEIANINKMFSRMYAPWRQNAVWYINQDIEPQLFGMTLGNYPIYLPPNGASGSPLGQLFGRDVIATQHCETLGDKGDIIFASLGQYTTVTKTTGVESAVSAHLWFDQDAVAFKFRMRVDGQPTMDSPIDPRDGSNTLSAFVTLDARA